MKRRMVIVSMLLLVLTVPAAAVAVPAGEQQSEDTVLAEVETEDTIFAEAETEESGVEISGEDVIPEDVGEENFYYVKSLPSALVKSLIAGKTFVADIGSYGWAGTEDNISIDFGMREPSVYSAEEIEGLEEGTMILFGTEGESVTVKTVEKDGDTVTAVPQEEWMTPLTFTKTEDGYSAEYDGKAVTGKTISFSVTDISPDFVCIAPDGSELTAPEMINAFSEDEINYYENLPEVTFDENGVLIKVEF